MTMLQVKLLGTPAFTSSGRELPLPPRVRLLAAYLFFYRGDRVPRAKLADLFWPEAGEDRALGSLRNALHALKSALDSAGDADLLETTRDAVCVPAASSCEVDAHRFEGAVRDALSAGEGADLSDLISSVSLYRGEFLSGMEDCPWSVEAWYRPERQRLHDLYVSGLSALVRWFSQTGLHHAALDYAARWRDADPLSEEASRSLMGLYAETGQPGRVAEEFERCSATLERELGVSPSEKTAEAYRRMSREAAKRRPGPGEAVDAPTPQQLSKDPLRNAHLLMVFGEQKALAGDLEEGMRALEDAREIYERMGDGDLERRARLTIAGVLLGRPVDPRPDLAVAQVMPLLASYRETGPSGDLGRALLIAADALQYCSAYQESAALAREGRELARSLGDKDLETRLDLVRGMALSYASEFAEATEALDSAIAGLGRLYRPHEMLRAMTARGTLAIMNESMADCEQYLLEAISIASRMPRTAMTVFTEGYARGLLVILYWGLERYEESRALAMDAGFDLGSAPGGNVLQAICVPGEDLVASAKTAANLLRESLASLPAWPAVGFSRILWQQMMSIGMEQEASVWSAVNVRLSRRLGQRFYEGTGYSCRGITHARLGRLKAAEACLERATEMLVAEHHYSMAYVTYLRAMVARGRGRLAEADELFEEALSRWRDIGECHVLGMISADMARVPNGG